jgi:hypothetical protein
VLSVEHNKHLTARIMSAVMSYTLTPQDSSTRLVLKIVMTRRNWRSVALAVGDLPMARRQLKRLIALAER